MQWFSNLKLSRKLMLGTVLKVGPFLLVCLLLLWAVADIGQRTDRLYRRHIKRQRYAAFGWGMCACLQMLRAHP